MIANREANQVRRRRSPSGYTLIELMIALALLSVLVVLVWSLLSTFTTAEQRAQRLAEQQQRLRGIRQFLEADLGKIVVAGDVSDTRGSAEKEPAFETDLRSSFDDQMIGSANALAGAGAFEGRANRLSFEIRLESDPTIWLESLVAPSLEISAATSSLQQPRAAKDTLFMTPTSAQVSFEIEEEVWGEEVVQFLVRRVELDSPSAPASLAALGTEENSLGSLSEQVDPDDYLDVSDLYRFGEDSELGGESEPDSEVRWGPLQNAKFRFTDGIDWSNSWGDQAGGKLPVAIELTFDFAPATLKPPEESLLEDSEFSDGEVEPMSAQESTLAFEAEDEEPVLDGDDLYRDAASEPEPREYRMVVLLEAGRWSQPPAPNKDSIGRQP